MLWVFALHFSQEVCGQHLEPPLGLCQNGLGKVLSGFVGFMGHTPNPPSNQEIGISLEQVYGRHL